MKVHKKVMQLTCQSAITMSLNYFSELISDHQKTLGRDNLAHQLKDQISELSNILCTFELSVDTKETIATYFNEIILIWVKSNRDIALRKPLNEIAQDLQSQYMNLANNLKQKEKDTEEQEAKKRTEKFKSLQRWNSSDFHKAKFEKTEEGDVICRLYNNSTCRLKRCKFKHVCNNCLGSHMAKLCPKSTQSKTTEAND